MDSILDFPPKQEKKQAKSLFSFFNMEFNL